MRLNFAGLFLVLAALAIAACMQTLGKRDHPSSDPDGSSGRAAPEQQAEASPGLALAEADLEAEIQALLKTLQDFVHEYPPNPELMGKEGSEFNEHLTALTYASLLPADVWRMAILSHDWDRAPGNIYTMGKYAAERFGRESTVPTDKTAESNKAEGLQLANKDEVKTIALPVLFSAVATTAAAVLYCQYFWPKKVESVGKTVAYSKSWIDITEWWEFKMKVKESILGRMFTFPENKLLWLDSKSFGEISHARPAIDSFKLWKNFYGMLGITLFAVIMPLIVSGGVSGEDLRNLEIAGVVGSGLVGVYYIIAGFRSVYIDKFARTKSTSTQETRSLLPETELTNMKQDASSSDRTNQSRSRPSSTGEPPTPSGRRSVPTDTLSARARQFLKNQATSTRVATIAHFVGGVAALTVAALGAYVVANESVGLADTTTAIAESYRKLDQKLSQHFIRLNKIREQIAANGLDFADMSDFVDQTSQGIADGSLRPESSGSETAPESSIAPKP